MRITQPNTVLVATLAAGLLTLGACTKTQRYAATGGAIGAGTGAVVAGAAGGSVAGGAIIGGAAGAIGGAILSK